jgi:hypothetical protein
MDPSGKDNVIALPRPASCNGPSDELLEILRGAVRGLGEIADGFERIHASTGWSPARWSAASVAFRMRLTSAGRQLAGLRQIDPAVWPDIGWSIALSSARADFERELRAMVSLVEVLVHEDLPAGERAWQAERFTSDSKGFLEALHRLHDVIVTRYPGTR